MMLGVPEKEFWDGDYTRLKFYVRMHNYAVERRNQELWLQGAYVYEAMSIALAHAVDPQHSRNKSYPDKPHRITPLSEDEKELEKKKQVAEFRAALEEMGRRFEAKHKRERELARRKAESDKDIHTVFPLLNDKGGEPNGN